MQRKHNPGGKSCPAWPADSTVTVYFSECGKYRNELAEIWDQNKPLVLWVLMNPSVACEDYSDPTLRKTGKFSRTWGYGGQLIGNLYAYRATDITLSCPGDREINDNSLKAGEVVDIPSFSSLTILYAGKVSWEI